MSDAEREMSLEEWVDRLPECHRARKELAELIFESTQLANIYTFADGWFGDECQNSEDVELVWNRSLKQAEEVALLLAGHPPKERGKTVTKEEKDPGVALGELWNAAIDFAEEMYEKLVEKYDEGYRGWDDSSKTQDIKDSLQNHVHNLLVHDSPQEVDIANLVMMLHRFRKEKKRVPKQRREEEKS